jgi:hypothetical protein
MSQFISDYLANALLDQELGQQLWTPPASIYIALFLVAPTGAGGGTEASLGGYSRKGFTNNLTNYPAAVSRTKNNATLIDFGTASADVGTLVGAATFDAGSGGNMLRYGSFTTPVVWSNGAPFTIAIGAGTFGYPSA